MKHNSLPNPTQIKFIWDISLYINSLYNRIHGKKCHIKRTKFVPISFNRPFSNIDIKFCTLLTKSHSLNCKQNAHALHYLTQASLIQGQFNTFLALPSVIILLLLSFCIFRHILELCALCLSTLKNQMCSNPPVSVLENKGLLYAEPFN